MYNLGHYPIKVVTLRYIDRTVDPRYLDFVYLK